MKTMMNRVQTRLTALLTALLATAFSASAQEAPENYLDYPQAFIGIQGGGQTTFTDYNNLKLITPTASIYGGVHFTPVIGARLHFNGIWNKGGFNNGEEDFKYKYKYLTSDLDLMVNMTNLLTKGDYHPLNVYLIGGVGLNYAWGNGTAFAHKQVLAKAYEHGRLSHNFRFGAMLDVKVARHWSVNLEVAANNLNDRYNSKYSGSGDWQLTAQVGIAYKFGLPHKANSRGGGHTGGYINTKDTDNETVSADLGKDISKQEKVTEVVPPAYIPEEPKDIRREIFFTLRGTEVSPTERPKLEQVAEWLKKHPNAKAVVTGYADKGTGNPTINARYAKQRANTVAKELTTKYGIAASRITTDSKGDTVQPFKNNNDQNRVAIVVAEE